MVIAISSLLLLSAGCRDDDEDTPDSGTDTGTSDGPMVDSGDDGPVADGPAADGPMTDGPVADSPMAVDKGPKPDKPPTPDLPAPSTFKVVITEFMANPSAVSDGKGEWLELYNAGTAAVDIAGWTLLDEGSDSHMISAGDAGASLSIGPGQYVVLSNNSDSTSNGGVTVLYQYTPKEHYIANSADELLLLDKSGLLVDRIAYTSSWGHAAGASLQLKSPTLDNNVSTNWCTSTTKWTGSAGDFGSPGVANSCATAVDSGPGTDATGTDGPGTD